MLRFSLISTVIAIALSLVTSAAEPQKPECHIVVSTNAPGPVREAAQRILEAASNHPLLRVLTANKMPTTLVDSSQFLAMPVEDRAFHHIIAVGITDDPTVKALWQREGRVIPGGLHVFGFGAFQGSIGYVESDRNPFLHSRFITKAPYETQAISITGSDAEAVRLAVDAFLNHGLTNGVLAVSRWQRTESTLLQRDPLPASFVAPEIFPAKIGEFPRIGLTQGSEEEVRGVLADTGIAPLEIWRAKYFVPGAWDGAGSANAFRHYLAGLHRRAYGNSIWAARFASPEEATKAAPKIASAAKLAKTSDGKWAGAQPPTGPEKESSGPLSLSQRSEWLLMSTLPANAGL